MAVIEKKFLILEYADYRMCSAIYILRTRRQLHSTYSAAGAHSRSVHVASPARIQICNSTTTFTEIEEDASKKARHVSESH